MQLYIAHDKTFSKLILTTLECLRLYNPHVFESTTWIVEKYIKQKHKKYL